MQHLTTASRLEHLRVWASTAAGYGDPAFPRVRFAHERRTTRDQPKLSLWRERRRASRAELDETIGSWRNRLRGSAPYAALAGKTQVFLYTPPGLSNRLSHTAEVAKIATTIAERLALSSTLAAATAEAHDIGHVPGGHVSEPLLGSFLGRTFSHASWGADIVLPVLAAPDLVRAGVRAHSWSSPRPAFPEAEIVAWADRIAYCCSDFRDGQKTGLVLVSDAPTAAIDTLGDDPADWAATLTDALVEGSLGIDAVAMRTDAAEALGQIRQLNTDRIYAAANDFTLELDFIRMLQSLLQDPASAAIKLLNASPGAALIYRVWQIFQLTDDEVRCSYELGEQQGRYPDRTATRAPQVSTPACA